MCHPHKNPKLLPRKWARTSVVILSQHPHNLNVQIRRAQIACTAKDSSCPTSDKCRWVEGSVHHGESEVKTKGTGQRTAPPLRLAIGEAGCYVRRIALRLAIKAIQPPFSNFAHTLSRNVNDVSWRFEPAHRSATPYHSTSNYKLLKTIQC